MGAVVATGKVVSFDDIRGYGFVAPAGGGEDVFVHVNDLDFDKGLIGIGAVVEFDVEEGDRGLKASHVRMTLPGAPKPASSAPVSMVDDDVVCDVLTMKEYLGEITEALLTAAPTLTAEQIVHIRLKMAQVARGHAWIEA